MGQNLPLAPSTPDASPTQTPPVLVRDSPLAPKTATQHSPSWGHR